jgi:hypothetical protein
MDDIIKVFVGGAVTVNLLKTELEVIGIYPIIKNGRQTGASAGFIGGTDTSVELYISQSETEKAEVIVEDFKQRQEENK